MVDGRRLAACFIVVGCAMLVVSMTVVDGSSAGAWVLRLLALAVLTVPVLLLAKSQVDAKRKQ